MNDDYLEFTERIYEIYKAAKPIANMVADIGQFMTNPEMVAGFADAGKREEFEAMITGRLLGLSDIMVGKLDDLQGDDSQDSELQALAQKIIDNEIATAMTQDERERERLERTISADLQLLKNIAANMPQEDESK
jgi:hypothetical protein